jgi:hypothetical protein
MLYSMDDGTLLRTAKPATATDSTFLRNGGPLGELWTTYSLIDITEFQVDFQIAFHFILSSNLSKSYIFKSSELEIQNNRKYCAYQFGEMEKTLGVLDETHPLQIPASPATGFYSPFYYYVVVPQLSNGWVLLGEHKYVSVSRQRFKVKIFM